MSLADKYKEELREQGINAQFTAYKEKKPHTKFWVVLVAVVAAAIMYSLIFQNYNACTVSQTSLLPQTNSSVTGNSFSLNCGLDTSMYGVAATIVIFIAVMLTLKILKYKKLK